MGIFCEVLSEYLEKGWVFIMWADRGWHCNAAKAPAILAGGIVMLQRHPLFWRVAL